MGTGPIVGHILAGRLPGVGGIVLGGIDSAIRITAWKDGRSCGGREL